MSSTDLTPETFAAAAKGSLIRLTTAGGVNATAVKRGDGTLLEVKRAGASKKQGYPSVDAWSASFATGDPVASISITPYSPYSPKDLRVTPLNPPTEDVKTVRRIHNPDDRSLITYNKMYYTPTRKSILSELQRVYDDASTSASDKDYLKWFLDTWGCPSYERSDRYQTPEIIPVGSKRCFQYVKNHTTKTLEPIYYYKQTSNHPFVPYRLYNIARKLFELPNEEQLYFRGKLGTTFAQLGVPLGPNGKPEFWKVINGGNIVKVE